MRESIPDAFSSCIWSKDFLLFGDDKLLALSVNILKFYLYNLFVGTIFKINHL